MLPSQYIQITALNLSQANYINTGVVPSDTLGLDILFSGVSSESYVFGSRNTNSTTSAGQTNLYVAQNAASYFGYRSARVSLTSNLLDLQGFMHVHTESNQIEVVNANAFIVNVEGSASTFTGTMPMYIGCMNNAGNPSSSGGCSLCGFKIYNSGVLTHDFIPCVNTATSRYGVYDDVTGNFIPSTSQSGGRIYPLTINATRGGIAYCHTFRGNKAKAVYAGNITTGTNDNYARLVAEAEAGYVFINWTDSNGNVISTDREFNYAVAESMTVTANFVKETSESASLGFKLMGIKYGENRNASLRDDFYSEVISADVKTDTMQKTVTTITVKEVPSTYQTNTPVVLFNSKGKAVYFGVIESINENAISCREPMSVYDDDFLFHVNTNIGIGVNLTTHSVMYGATQYMDLARNRNTDTLLGDANLLQQRKLYPFVSRYNLVMNLDESRVFNIRMARREEASISNLEDYLLSLFDDFGICVRTSLKYGRRDAFALYDSHYFEMKPTYIKELDTLKLSDNVESIQNVSINIEEAESTVLIIYNSAGTSVRQYVGMKNDGSIKTFDGSTTAEELQSFIGYDRYKVKVVSSDDDLATLKAQNLSNSMYNHKISFSLGLDGKMFDIDTIKLGQPVDFYYQNKLYTSVVTGISFAINENDDRIHSLNITMGKVRTSLTSKLNLGKVKK